MTVLGVVIGLALVAVALIDLAWTTVAAGSGAGPLTARLAGATWHAALAVHRRRPSHRFLAVAGVVIVVVILATWILGVLMGWALLFASSEGAVRSTATGQPVGTGDRLYFTGYTLFTLGNGELRPGEGAWQLATVAATGTGLILVTLGITYLVPVASAVAERRQLASYVSALGEDAADILGRAWDGSGFGSLTQHLVALAPLIDAARQRHLTYPVLHYYHSPDHTTAPAARHPHGGRRRVRPGHECQTRQASPAGRAPPRRRLGDPNPPARRSEGGAGCCRQRSGRVGGCSSRRRWPWSRPWH